MTGDAGRKAKLEASCSGASVSALNGSSPSLGAGRSHEAAQTPCSAIVPPPALPSLLPASTGTAGQAQRGVLSSPPVPASTPELPCTPQQSRHCSTDVSPVLPAQGQGAVAWAVPSVAHRHPHQHPPRSRPSPVHGPSPAATRRRGGSRWSPLNMHEVQVAQ